MKNKTHKEIADRLEEIRDEMKDNLEEARDLITFQLRCALLHDPWRADELWDRAECYWYAHIRVALDQEHDWSARDARTLAGTIKEISDLND